MATPMIWVNSKFTERMLRNPLYAGVPLNTFTCSLIKVGFRLNDKGWLEVNFGYEIPLTGNEICYSCDRVRFWSNRSGAYRLDIKFTRIEIETTEQDTVDSLLRAINCGFTSMKCGQVLKSYIEELTNLYREIRDHDDILGELLEQKQKLNAK